MTAVTFGCDNVLVTADSFSTCKGLLEDSLEEVGMESILPDAVRGRLEEAEDVAAIVMWFVSRLMLTPSISFSSSKNPLFSTSKLVIDNPRVP